jgi:hypothetical protein
MIKTSVDIAFLHRDGFDEGRNAGCLILILIGVGDQSASQSFVASVAKTNEAAR